MIQKFGTKHWRRQKNLPTKEIIGLIGTHPGVGVTYTGLMLAFYMGEECGKQTAYLECNDHQDMIAIYSSYQWKKEEEDSFFFHRVTCYPQVTSDQIPAIMNEDYDCIIIDFGCDYQSSKEELLRCHKKIVIGGRASWEGVSLLNFWDETKALPGGLSWQYFIPQASNKLIKEVKKEVKREISAVPFIEEPVLPSKVINQFFQRIFD